MCSSGGLERVARSEAALDGSLVEHIGNNSSRNALSLIAFNTIVHHRAFPDIAVGDFSITRETCGNTARTTISLLVINGHILYAKSGDCTGNFTKDACKDRSTDLTIADDEAATVVGSSKWIPLRADGAHRHVRQVDVGLLLHVEIGVAHIIDVFSQVLQVGAGGHLVRVSLSALGLQFPLRVERQLPIHHHSAVSCISCSAAVGLGIPSCNHEALVSHIQVGQ